MTDSILTLNSSSALLNALAGGQDGSAPMSKLTDPFTFRTKYNVLSTSKKIVKIDPRNQPTAAPFSKTVNFDILKNGLWEWAVIQVNLTLNADESVNNGSSFAARIFSELIISAHGSVIARLCPEAIHALIEHSPVNKSLQYKKMLNGNAPTLTAGAVTFYIPIMTFNFENTYNYMYLNALEDLQVQCTFNSRSNMGLTADTTACTVYLHCCYRNMTTPMLNAYKSFMFKENKKLQQLAYSFEQETPQALTAAVGGVVTTRKNILAEKVVAKTYFYFARTDGNFGPVANFKITSVTVNINGDEVFREVPIELLNYDNAILNDRIDLAVSQAGALTNDTEIGAATGTGAVYCINWALLNDNNSYTGGVAFKGNNSSITIVSAYTAFAGPLAATAFQLHMVHQYHRVVNVESNGRLSVFDAL
ncbi:MAG: hypothetical protein KFKLKKLM_02636 [Flavobacteriales bacterium]|nr:hypothetical protein [Flavobacteriales bacterium]